MMKAAPWPVTMLFAASLALNLWLAGVPDWRWIPAALAAWYIADLLSGLTHMYMDYRPCTPGIGLDRMFHYSGSRESGDYLALRDSVLPRISPFERLVYDFKNHHPRPDALGRRPFLVQIGSTILFVSLPMSILLNLAGFAMPLAGWFIAGAVVLIAGGTLAQYFHGTLHRPVDDSQSSCPSSRDPAPGLRDQHGLVQSAGQHPLLHRDEARLAQRGWPRTSLKQLQ